MKFKKLVNILLIVITIAALPACKSKRAVIKAPIKERGPEYLFENLKANEFKFETFSAKFSVDYKYDKNHYDFKGQIRIIKDSMIWVSFNQDLGIEIARLLITQDSVKFLDRFNKKFFAGDYHFVNNFLNTNIDFGILQSIILGNDFEYYERAEFKASIDGGQYRLSTASRSKLKKYVRNSADAQRILLQSIWLNPSNFKITEIKLKELTRDSKKLNASYGDFEMLGGQLFPHKVKYEVEADVPIGVEVKYIRINLNEEIRMPFNIPSKYTPAK
ncbi:MAG: DUF4292 domain-containing protein [Bacteroidales bacterium]